MRRMPDSVETARQPAPGAQRRRSRRAAFALTTALSLVLALGLAACGDDDCSGCSPTPVPTATPAPPGEVPFSCVIAACGADVTCASLGIHTNPESQCYLYNDLYLCCRQSPFE